MASELGKCIPVSRCNRWHFPPIRMGPTVLYGHLLLSPNFYLTYKGIQEYILAGQRGCLGPVGLGGECRNTGEDGQPGKLGGMRIEFQGGPLDGTGYSTPGGGRARAYFYADGRPMPTKVGDWAWFRKLESQPVPKVYECYLHQADEVRDGERVRIYRYRKYKAVLDEFKHVYGLCDRDVCRCARASLYDEFNRAPDSHLSPGRLKVKDPRVGRGLFRDSGVPCFPWEPGLETP